MATKHEETRHTGGGTFLRPLGLSAAAVVVIVAIAVLWSDRSGAPKTAGAEADQQVEQRPTGAGTNPDGVADETVEGLANETATDDFVDSSAAADADVNIVEPEGGPEPETSASDVDPAVTTGDDPVERIVEGSEDSQ